MLSQGCSAELDTETEASTCGQDQECSVDQGLRTALLEGAWAAVLGLRSRCRAGRVVCAKHQMECSWFPCSLACRKASQEGGMVLSGLLGQTPGARNSYSWALPLGLYFGALTPI